MIKPGKTEGKGASRSGVWVIAAMIGLAGLFLLGLYVTAWVSVPGELRRAEAGAPGLGGRALRVAVADLGELSASGGAVVGALRECGADFVLIDGVRVAEAQTLARELGMMHEGRVQMYFTPGAIGENERGQAVLGRFAVYQGRALRVEGMKGVAVDAVVEGKRFVVAVVVGERAVGECVAEIGKGKAAIVGGRIGAERWTVGASREWEVGVLDGRGGTRCVELKKKPGG